MIALLSVVMLFHLSVFLQFIPYTIVWAGKLKNLQEMRVFESVSLLLSTFNIAVFLMKGNYIRHKIPMKIINGIIWFFVVLFAFNTVGNLFAKSDFELYVFTPLTFISALLCLRIVWNKNG
ncbi:MAG: hypothetical protein WCK78_01965 [Paludibacter sp.]